MTPTAPSAPISIVFLDRAGLRADVRAPAFAHSWVDYDSTPPGAVVERLGGARIAVTNKVPLRAPELARLPDLRMIAVAATGTDMIDLAACRERGIVVSNIRNYANATLPEHVFALILALRRNLLAFRADVESGAWQQAEQFCLFSQRIDDLAGSTLGLIGFGALGRAVARLGRAFGMKVIVHTRTPDDTAEVAFVDFARVLETSDVLSLHLPLTAATRGFIGRDQLARMKSSAVLINTARGGLVDEQALADALRRRQIAGAGFDVLSKEPPDPGNPLLQLRLPNFILTPHVAWASAQAMQALADQLVDNIEAYVRGDPRNVVS